MNLPNRITLLRVVLIPAFLLVYMAKPFPDAANEWLAFFLFSTAAATDALDGYLARKMKLVTNFGKLMDPLADKLLVCAAFIAFTATGTLPAWAAIIFVSREFFISGLRQLALEQKIVVAASTSAKIKTGLQIFLVGYILLPFPFNFFRLEHYPHDILTITLVVITAAVSVYSAAEYAYKNLAVFGKEGGQ